MSGPAGGVDLLDTASRPQGGEIEHRPGIPRWLLVGAALLAVGLAGFALAGGDGGAEVEPPGPEPDATAAADTAAGAEPEPEPGAGRFPGPSRSTVDVPLGETAGGVADGGRIRITEGRPEAAPPDAPQLFEDDREARADGVAVGAPVPLALSPTDRAFVEEHPFGTSFVTAVGSRGVVTVVDVDGGFRFDVEPPVGTGIVQSVHRLGDRLALLGDRILITDGEFGAFTELPDVPVMPLLADPQSVWLLRFGALDSGIDDQAVVRLDGAGELTEVRFPGPVVVPTDAGLAFGQGGRVFVDDGQQVRHLGVGELVTGSGPVVMVRSCREDQACRLDVRDLDGRTVLTDVGLPVTATPFGGPLARTSPDGRWLVHIDAQSFNGPSTDLHLLDLTTGDVTVIEGPRQTVPAVTWTDNSDWFVAERAPGLIAWHAETGTMVTIGGVPLGFTRFGPAALPPPASPPSPESP